MFYPAGRGISVLSSARWTGSSVVIRVGPTPQRLRILQLRAEGCSLREVADRMFLTRDTVVKHQRLAFRELDVSNISQALAVAIENDWWGHPPRSYWLRDGADWRETETPAPCALCGEYGRYWRDWPGAFCSAYCQAHWLWQHVVYEMKKAA